MYHVNTDSFMVLVFKSNLLCFDPNSSRAAYFAVPRVKYCGEVKDSNLRELCSIAEQRQVLAAPARSKGT